LRFLPWRLTFFSSSVRAISEACRSKINFVHQGYSKENLKNHFSYKQNVFLYGVAKLGLNTAVSQH